MMSGMSTALLTRTAAVPLDSTNGPKRGRFGPAWWWGGIAACVLIATVLRVWGAAANSGVGNSYYAAAALSMSQDWAAFFTGGLDSENFVSIDKPAPWLWPSALLIKAFGLNWATLFLPSAIAGVLSVLVVALAVREGFGDGPAAKVAGLLAALGLAISPMNVAVDRDNHPDAILLLALLLAAWLTLRAVRRGRVVPLVGAGALVGLAFNAKYVQAYIVLPALVLVWVACAAGSIKRRLAGLGGMAAATLAVSAAWPLAVALLPSGDRPWIAGTADGTILTRLTSIVDIHFAPPQFPGMGPQLQMLNAFLTGEVFHAGPAGKSRLLSGVLADQISWWLPLAVFAALIIAISLQGRGRRDPSMAGLVLWSGWALSCWAVFSFMGGVLHPYYTSMMVPAVAALAASGLVTSWLLWRRGSTFGTVTLVAQIVLVTGWSAWVLLDTSAQRPSWLVPVVLGAGVLAIVALVIAKARAAAAVGALLAVAALTAPLAWSIKTTDQRLFGGNPLANQDGRYRPALLPKPMADGFMNQLEPRIDPRLVDFLQQNKGEARWLAATLTAMSASPLIVAADGEPVMALGGYDGQDPMPTPQRFQELVRSGEVRFVIAPPAANGTNSFLKGPPVEVIKWATSTCRPVELGAGVPAGAAPQLLDCLGAA